ncbi:hypothetical protein [Formosa sp. PL04]|uniref:hypothetical protein n=1 Tax=Formosa sp. PL04 TaxID=3081755 RepID=UPI002981D015|nr:hypothetical protein [Formosa sp. PL04]MDW5291007.1 hypothetical protein [Formosa sp. PL04]
MLHIMSHYVEDRIHTNKEHLTSISNSHAHDAFGNHLTSEAPPLANHTHTATGKIIPNHSHNVLAVLDVIISTSNEQKEHQKSIFKAEIDKHLLTSEFSIKNDIFNTTSKKTWYTFLFPYKFDLSTLSPPPKFIS